MMKKLYAKVNVIIYFIFNVLAIKQVFPQATNYVCSWHVQQNFKKKFCYLNRGKEKSKKDLYQSIINLPYSNYREDFVKNFSAIKKSRSISSELKKYLEDKYAEKEVWVRGYMKVNFCCGMCTTSRIEAKHRVLKQFLNSGKRLTEFFNVIKDLEQREILNFENEIEKSNKFNRKKEEKSDLIKYFKNDYGDYVIERLKDNLIQSTNYKITEIEENKWQVIH